MKRFKSLFCLCMILGLLVILTSCPKSANTVEPKGMMYFSFFDTVSYIYSYAEDSQEEFQDRCGNIAGMLGEYHIMGGNENDRNS